MATDLDLSTRVALVELENLLGEVAKPFRWLHEVKGSNPGRDLRTMCEFFVCLRALMALLSVGSFLLCWERQYICIKLKAL